MRRIGSVKERRVKVRLIAATNRDLTDMVAAGSFREDLLYRLNLIGVHLPPLRERHADIRILADHFLATVQRAMGSSGLRLTPAAYTWLNQQTWPGNIRQLKATLERAALLTDRSVLDVSDLAAGEASVVMGLERATLPPVGAMTLDEIERSMIDKAMRHHEGNITHVAEALGLTRAALYRRLKKHGLAT